MGEICLSVAPILRCQSLTRLEAGIFLLPPGLEIIFAIVLLLGRGSADKKNVLLSSEVFVYFLLAILDLLTHAIPNIGTSLESFKALDIIIGVASLLPLFLYTFSLYLLSAGQLIPSLPARFQSLAKYVLLAFIPLILIMNELGSFIGITYRAFGGTNGQPLALGVGFSSGETEMFMSSVTLVLLAAYQAINFVIAFYRLLSALSFQRSLETREKTSEEKTTLFRGLGWLVVGTKLGAIETVIGFAQGGFAVALTRRLLRMLSRGCLIIGLLKGLDTVEDFRLYSPSEAQRKRKSALRALIQNPRFSTFRHVGGHDFEKQHMDPFDDKHASVIKLGDPSWMRRDRKGSAAADEERYTPGLMQTQRKSSRLTFQLSSRPSMTRRSVRDSVSSFGSVRRSSWSLGESSYVDLGEDLGLTPLSPNTASRQRVTVFIRQDRLPILELRRFSNLDFLDLIQDPFRDPPLRSRSLPLFENPRPAPAGETSKGKGPAHAHAISASFTRLPVYQQPPMPAPPLPTLLARANTARDSRSTVRSNSVDSRTRKSWAVPTPGIAIGSPSDSAVSFGSQRMSIVSSASYEWGYDDESRPESTLLAMSPEDMEPASPPAARPAARAMGTGMSALAIMTDIRQPPSSFRSAGVTSPSDTIASFESPESYAGHGFQRESRSRFERGLSSSTTASEVNALATQFPGVPGVPAVPSRPTSYARGAAPARRSLLSREVKPSQMLSPDSEYAPSLPVRAPVRTPSSKRKPAPLLTRGLVEEGMRDVEVVQDDSSMVGSLPTPESAPHYPSSLGRAGSRTRPPGRSSHPDVPENASPSSIGVVRSASLAKRDASASPRLVRVKSVGKSPAKSVARSRIPGLPRESIKVELGHIAAQGRTLQEDEAAIGAAV
ncbi:uncharacterized protein BXZ73DRAFT_48551 [Epithele typhae]|uniref:uncharacterized protein n=1 Tax=Epithele typhae TaxID=378194 RepID=UPI002007742E|nr:uncharacterized protein BXZ73DRAFT_48551 [Epithele typhae]KAH9928006.1 hypothetical protein BXZ73DRAFT_48551 [Epithele typhae]